MEYELAEELRNAGFPFIEIKAGMCVGELQGVIDFNPRGLQELGAQHFYEPTLEELIEACGDEFDAVGTNYTGGWFAFYTKNFEKYDGFGSTPTEAVARLWLDLNPVDKLGKEGGTTTARKVDNSGG